MKVDIKSFLFGVIILLFLMIVIGQKSRSDDLSDLITTMAKLEGSGIGRYQVVIPNTESYEKPILVDTKTGATYHLGTRAQRIWFGLDRWVDLPDSLKTEALKVEWGLDK